MCGSDYVAKIDKVGPVKAHKLVLEHGSIKKVLEMLGNEETKAGNLKYEIDDNFY